MKNRKAYKKKLIIEMENSEFSVHVQLNQFSPQRKKNGEGLQ